MENAGRISLARFIASASMSLLFCLCAGRVAAQERAIDAANGTPDQKNQSAGSFPHRLRVLSYNIHHAEGTDGRLDLPRIARIIQSVQPDLVALQEVDSKVERSKSVDQPQELARLTGMKVVFGANIPLQGGHYGNAVLSRSETVRSENRLLPNIDQGEQRGVLDATVQHDGQMLRILATHFDHRRDSKERLESIEMINKLVSEPAAKKRSLPTLLVGDLNAEFSSEVLDRARSLWKVANAERLPTIPVTKPERQIDFILSYPADSWQVHQVKVLDEQVASDHRPIMAELSFR